MPSPSLPPALDMSGHVALVTGSSSPLGIGFAAARLLGTLGASVVVTGTTERAKERAAELHALGIEADWQVADLMDRAQAEALVAFTVERFGALDVLVNNAGLASVNDPETPNTLGSITDEEWDVTLSRNLTTALYVTRAALPHMQAKRYGRIVNIGSMAGDYVAYPGDVGYHAAKAGMVGMTKSLAYDVAREGITVNVVCPGWIDTGIAYPTEVDAGSVTPLGRAGTADEVATVIAMVAAPGASYMTGSSVLVDGGNVLPAIHAEVPA